MATSKPLDCVEAKTLIDKPEPDVKSSVKIEVELVPVCLVIKYLPVYILISQLQMLHKSTSIDVIALQREQVEDAQVRDENRSNYWKDKKAAVNRAGRSCCHGVGLCCQQMKSCMVGIGDCCCNVVDLFLSCLSGIGSCCYDGLRCFCCHIPTVFESYKDNFWGIHLWLWTLGVALIIAAFNYEEKVPMVLSLVYLVLVLVDEPFLIACGIGLLVIVMKFTFEDNDFRDKCLYLFLASVMIPIITVAGLLIWVAFNIIQLRVGYNLAKYHGNFDILDYNYKTKGSIETIEDSFNAVTFFTGIFSFFLFVLWCKEKLVQSCN